MSESRLWDARYESLRSSRRLLSRLAPVVQFGLLVVGLALFLSTTRDLVSDVQFTYGERVVLGIVALVYLGGFGLAGWVVGRLLRVSSDLIEVLVDQAEAASRTADLVERQVAPALSRMAVSLERAATTAPRDDGRVIAIAGVRQAIETGRWDQAERLVKALVRDFPDAPEASRLAEDVAEGRQQTIDDLHARLDAARHVNDPEQVIAYRDELTQYLRGEPLKDLDKQVLRWLMSLLQRRMRTGTVRADVATLAARIAESFGDTAEGASLRAALPTLRRSAGLCPRCASPYSGIDDACPQCLGRPAAAPPDAPAPPSPASVPRPTDSRKASS